MNSIVILNIELLYIFEGKKTIITSSSIIKIWQDKFSNIKIYKCYKYRGNIHQQEFHETQISSCLQKEHSVNG